MSIRSISRRAAALIAGGAIASTMLAQGTAGGVLPQAPPPGVAAPEAGDLPSTARARHGGHRCFAQTDNPQQLAPLPPPRVRLRSHGLSTARGHGDRLAV